LTRPPLDVQRCEELAMRALEGDGKARRAVIEELWPVWTHIVRNHRSMGSLASSTDHVEEVVARLAEKFGRSDGHMLKKYFEWRRAHDDRTFADWNRIVAKNAILDYVREAIGTARVGDGELSPKRLLNELAYSGVVQEGAHRPPFTEKQAARELLEFASAHLSADQLRAMRLWLEDADFEEIARDMRMTPDGAKKLVRAGIAVLRRRFGTEVGGK
jgi:DNA-directed RNA polymerase specialized sigma24 family protein